MVYTILSTLVGKLLLKEDLNFRKGISILLCIIGCGLILLGLISTVQFTQNESKDTRHLHVYNESKDAIKNVTDYQGNFPSVNNTCTNAMLHMNSEQPDVIHQDQRNIRTTTIQGLIYGLFLCAANGIFSCIAMYCSTKMKDHVEDVLIFNFWYNLVSIIISGTMMLTVEWHHLTIPTKLDDIIYTVIHALTTASGQLLWFALISFISFLAITMFVNGETIVKILCQYFIFPELQPIKGGLFDFVGAIIITIGLIIPSVPELWQLYRRDKASDKSEDSESTPLANNPVE